MNVKVGIIGGSGLADAFSSRSAGQWISHQTPYGQPSSPVLETQVQGVPVAFIARHGQGHIYPPSAVNYRANVYALKQVGCTHLISSGAVGSLSEDLKPRSLVLVDQFIDKTFRRASSFFDLGPVAHVELAQPACPVLSGILRQAGDALACRVHPDGTYVCMEGPQFSTRAESLLHKGWRAQLIGMTAMPEAKLAREAEMAYALIAMVTDFDCWRPHVGPADSLLAEIIGHLHAATDLAIQLIHAALELIATMPAEALASPAHTSLDLAVWTRPESITAEQFDRCGVLLHRWKAARGLA